MIERKLIERLRRSPTEDLVLELVGHPGGRRYVEIVVWFGAPKWRVSLRSSELRQVAAALLRAADRVGE